MIRNCPPANLKKASCPPPQKNAANGLPWSAQTAGQTLSPSANSFRFAEELSDSLVNSLLDVSGNNRHIRFRCRDRLIRLHFTDERDVVESDVALAAHPIEEVEGRRKRWIEVLLSELKNSDMVAELHTRSLSVA